MPNLQNTLRAKFREAEALSARIRQLDRDNEEQKAEILRWAVIGDELTRMLIAAEEHLPEGCFLASSWLILLLVYRFCLYYESGPGYY